MLAEQREVCMAERLYGRELTPAELERIRMELENFDEIGAVNYELRGIVERNWPHLVSKLPPRSANDP
jgi:hypothetical protein